MKSMKSMIVAVASLFLLASAGPALAGKSGTIKCRSDKNCKNGICVRQSPADRSGICCQPRGCGEVEAQCGDIDNGCGGLTQCGTCSPDSDCIDNQCIATPTTSTTSTTTTTDSTTSTTLDNPCIPDPCTSCGGFGFFWCLAYMDGTQQCVFNEISSGGCESDANCDVAGGDRCAYDSSAGYKRCVRVTGVCP